MFQLDTLMDLSAILTDATADNDHRMVMVDLGNSLLRREFLLTGRTITEADTAPGSSKNLVVNYYFSDVIPTLGSGNAITAGEVMTDSTDIDDIAAQLADRKTASGNKTLTDAVSTTQIWDFTDETPVRTQARYLFVSFNKPQLDSNATADLTIWLARVPQTMSPYAP